MKHLTCYIFLAIFALFSSLFLKAQDTLVYQNFDDCVLPTDWSTNAAAGIDEWSFGWHYYEWDDTTTSIDSTCMAYFDDHFGDYYAPGSINQLISPSFDGSLFSTLNLEVDVHFTPANGASLNFYIFDGTSYQLLARYDDDNWISWLFGTWDSPLHLRKDFSQYAHPNNHIMVEYDDNDEFSYWAGIDNFLVTGTGDNTNFYHQSFDDCTLPLDWTTNVVTGLHDWQFGTDDSLWWWVARSFDGSCMAYFNDSAIEDGDWYTPPGPSSRIELLSPVFDGTQFGSIFLDVDVFVHFYGYLPEYFRILVNNGTGTYPVKTYEGMSYSDEWGYHQFTHETFDLSQYRTQTMQVIFEFYDGNHQSGWVGIDNFRLSGNGFLSDFCFNSVSLNVGDACSPSTNVNALFDGVASSCVANEDAGVWFDFIAPASGSVTIHSNADFNDVITLFSGTCANHSEVACTNSAEFGFKSESLFVTGLTAGQSYYVRISGADCTFGASEGNLCVEILDGGSILPPPVNDVCSGATPLNLDATCVAGTNVNATFDGPVPILNNKSNHSIWYSFVAPATGNLNIHTNADFADVITVFSGTCGSLTEVIGTDFGPDFYVEGLTAGETYFLQIAGAFATVEGNVCMQLATPGTPPTNDICSTAIDLTLGETCRTGSNELATFTGALIDMNVPFTHREATTIGQPTYNRPWADANCYLSNIPSYYDAHAFTVDTDGDYTFVNDYMYFHGWLYIHQGNFDPNDPCATYIAGNEGDDWNGTSTLTVSLTAGTPYYLVTSSWGDWEYGNFTTTITSTAGYALHYVEDLQLNGTPTSCDAQPAAAVWYKFVAPTSGTVRINSGAEFMHTLTVFAGFCGEFTEVGCAFNPSKCDGAVAFNNLVTGDEYFLQIASAHNFFGYNYGDFCMSIHDNAAPPVKAKIKALLEGAYNNNGMMTTTLNDNQQLPDDQPYYAAPWHHTETECVGSFPATMTDWVLVELRDATDATLVVERKAAILLSNGNIIDPKNDGVLFNRAVDGQSYYIVVRHRNHLAVMSSVPVPLPNMNHYNFTAGTNMAFGADQMVEVETGVFALYAGDFNSDGLLTVSDFNFYDSQTAVLNDYNDADANLDRNVTVADFNLYQPNASVIGVIEIRY